MAKSLFDHCMTPLALKPLGSITNADRPAGYLDDAAIQRYHAADPLYSSVHLIVDAGSAPRQYSPPHVHPFPELNILAAAPGQLVFRILIGEEEREVESPATILIPPGVRHAANLVRGTGAFVVARLMPEQLQASYDAGAAVPRAANK